ncbi:hypothetical protein G7K_6293-t1 [Saitoella complicata NRRL Y-17804]|uniref:Uncharacterized protein n=1 Tax=Saitoella complicata (strain BCRC 22490 / CBS 7301 / JCM 7358 / NBRC 10748 / NRRL Y-17804) TaxID=698492 RepID=A0A0E9NS01_SAICN|nr:hypothetical protein G7K_6293-t1 [Saitoella complicata NRRL Y-17804]
MRKNSKKKHPYPKSQRRSVGLFCVALLGPIVVVAFFWLFVLWFFVFVVMERLFFVYVLPMMGPLLLFRNSLLHCLIIHSALRPSFSVSSVLRLLPFAKGSRAGAANTS